MPHALATHDTAGNNLASLINRHIAAADTFVARIVRIYVLYRTEDTLVKQSVAFGPFIPPPEPADATVALVEEIASLRLKVAESEDAAARARRETEEHARARESVEQRLTREAEERAL